MRLLARLLPSVLLSGMAGLMVLPAAARADDPPAVRIAGRVVDARTGAPVPGARVTLNSGEEIRAEPDGTFDAPYPSGTYRIRISRLGYRPFGGDVTFRRGAVVDLPVEPRPTELEEMTVTPGAFSFMDNAGNSRQTMSREEMLSVPQLGEDVFRAVNRLPGLSSGDYAAHFSIRGGRHDETLILLDGLELQEPYHLKDFNEGAISIVDAETVQGVQLMTGGFPAAFGNKRSGVFDISSRLPDFQETRASMGLSLMNARGLGMGPLGGGRGAWIASARSGYMDVVFNLINQADLPSPRYHDVFGKLQWELARGHQFQLNALHAGDRYTFDAASTTGFQDTLATREKADNRYGNSSLWASVRSDLGSRVTVRNLLSVSRINRDRDGSEKYVDRTEPLYSLRNRRRLTILGFKQDTTFRLAEAFQLSLGADLRRLSLSDDLTSEVGQDPNDPSADPNAFYPIVTRTTKSVDGTSAGLYVSSRWRVARPLVLEAGGRYDYADHTRDSDFSPRLSASWEVADGRVLRAGWGHYRQIQGIDDVSALDARASYYRSELSTQWTAGFEQSLGGGGVFRAEVYRKDGSHLRPVYRNWKGGIDTFPETNEDRILVYPETSRSRGIELYLQRPLGPRSSLSASYALSRSDEVVSRIDNVNGEGALRFDRTHPTPQDQTHAANVDCTFGLTRTWSVSASLALRTGWPSTHEALVPTTDGNGNPDFSVRPETIYGHRLPLYQRLDARLTRRWSNGRGDWRMFVELVNVTNHANVFGYDYVKEGDPANGFRLARGDEQWFTILPSLGVSWTSRF